jgi:DNA repair exonuclease SbcCD ATPase subunit
MTVVAAGVVAGGALIGGIISSSSAKREARRKERQAAKLNAKLENLEKNRQKIINPFEGVESLSGMLSNPFASLGVATQAAEMKIEQTDQALANTLDTIRQTGGGAGSATALAQAALQAKQGVAASIEQQEVANEKQRAAGEQQLQQQQMAEAQRIQQADVSGKQFVFGQKENREMQQLNRLSNQIGALRGQAAAANQAGAAALTGAISSATSVLGAGIAAKPA